MKRPKLRVRFSANKGQASVEFILVMPLLVIILLALLTVGRLLYVHLALITAANDCATSAAQATEFDPMMSQGFAARQHSLASFQVSQSVSTGGIYSAVSAHNGFGNIACQVGYPLKAEWLGNWAGSILVGHQFFSVQYTINEPWQAYKSDWTGVP